VFHKGGGLVELRKVDDEQVKYLAETEGTQTQGTEELPTPEWDGLRQV
jgi:hypothetical protein